MNNIPISIFYQGMLLKGHADMLQLAKDLSPLMLKIYIQGWCLGTLSHTGDKWTMDKPIDPKFVEALGQYICSYSLFSKN